MLGALQKSQKRPGRRKVRPGAKGLHLRIYRDAVGRNYRRSKLKSALDFSVKDASAALPQNCQTTEWILRNYSFCVNVTLVMGIVRARELPSKGIAEWIERKAGSLTDESEIYCRRIQL
jgi:hypothetical protein